MDSKTLILTLSVVLGCSGVAWDVRSLVSRSPLALDSLHIADPDGLLTAEETQKLLGSMAKYQDSNLRLVLLDNLHPEYSITAPQNPAQAFLDELTDHFGDGSEAASHSATILVVTSRRECRVRIGEAVSPKLLLEKVEKFQSRLQTMDPKADLASELRQLLDDDLKGMNPESLAVLIGVITLILPSIVVVYCVCSDTSVQRKQPVQVKAPQGHLQRRIAMAERVEKSPQAMQVFIEQTCVICFGELDNSLIPEHRPSHYPELKLDSDDLDLTATTLEEHLLGEDKIRIYASPKPVDIRDLGDSKGKESVFLSCRHNFHAGCLRLWLQKSKTCPICRATFEAEKKNPANREEAVMHELTVGNFADEVFEQFVTEAAARCCIEITLHCCVLLVQSSCDN